MAWSIFGRSTGALLRGCAFALMATVMLDCGFRPQPTSGTVACKPQKGSCCPEGYLCVGRGVSTAGGPSAGVCWDKRDLPPEALTGTHDYTLAVINDPPCLVTDWVPPELGGLVSAPDAAIVRPTPPPIVPEQPYPGPTAPVAQDAGRTLPDAKGADPRKPDTRPDDGPTKTVLVSGFAVGNRRSYALIAGGLWRWGQTMAIGYDTLPDEIFPVPVPGLESDVTAVFGGDFVTCVVVKGILQCWGGNGEGELGDGTTTSRVTPAPVLGLGSGVTAVAIGYFHLCAVVNGGAWCWGGAQGQDGALGDDKGRRSLVPVQVSGLESGVTAIAAGRTHSCAVVNGGVRCWGTCASGGLGDGTGRTRFAPVDVVGLRSGATAVAAGLEHTCALVNGGVQCWGRNASSELGNGGKEGSLVPVQVTGLSANATDISASWIHTCAVVNGEARCWGEDSSITSAESRAPGEVAFHVDGLASGVLGISTAEYHSCARLAQGVKCWGDNSHGQLGNGTKSPRPPVGSVWVQFP